MLSLKEYYKNILIKSLQEAAPPEEPREEQHWNPAVNHPLHVPDYAREKPDIYGNDPTLFNPTFFPSVTKNWPPIPDSILPMWTHPNGDMIWIIPGPPTVVYISQTTEFPIHDINGVVIGSRTLRVYHTLVSANNGIPVAPGSSNSWYHYEGQPTSISPDGTIHFGDGWAGGSRPFSLDEIWPGWLNPYTPPPTGESINPNFEYTTPWDNVPTYPGWDADQPNWIRPNPWTPYDDRINWHMA